MIYRNDWNRFYNAAAAQRTAAAAVEARIHLQQLMRTAKSVTIRREAARLLARLAPAEPAGDIVDSAKAGCASAPKP